MTETSMKLMVDSGPTDIGSLDFGLLFGAVSTGGRYVVFNEIFSQHYCGAAE